MNKDLIRLKLLNIKKLLLRYFSRELSSLQVKELFIDYIRLYLKLDNLNPKSTFNFNKYINDKYYSFFWYKSINDV